MALTLRPTRDESLMAIAEIMSQRSTCSRAQVGAVISRGGRILVSGYNGAPAGTPHCDHDEGIGQVVGCTTAVHAEANAIAFAARWGISVEGAEMHSTYTPCLPCAQLIINAGIIRVVSKQAYRDPAGLALLIGSGVITR